MSKDFVEEFSDIAKGAIAEFDVSSPQQKDAFRRAFVFAFAAGFLQPMNPESPLVTPEHVALRERIRQRMREQQAEHAGQTALEAFLAGQEILVEEYDAVADKEPGLKVEGSVAHATRDMVLSSPFVDEAFAAEVLAFAKL